MYENWRLLYIPGQRSAELFTKVPLLKNIGSAARKSSLGSHHLGGGQSVPEKSPCISLRSWRFGKVGSRDRRGQNYKRAGGQRQPLRPCLVCSERSEVRCVANKIGLRQPVGRSVRTGGQANIREMELVQDLPTVISWNGHNYVSKSTSKCARNLKEESIYCCKR